jgi:hopanoid biosynthesis associated protein HpnK
VFRLFRVLRVLSSDFELMDDLRNGSGIPLIISGDDFGYSEPVNRAIIRAHHDGVLTSASLMVNERAVDHAIDLARVNASLAVGLHLVLVSGRAALPHQQIAHITDSQGRFAESPLRAGLNYYFSPEAQQEMRREMRAQFERFASTRLPFSHVDGHMHLHMHPSVFVELIKLCEEFEVRRVRVVKGEVGLSLKLDRKNLRIKFVWGAIFTLLGRWCEKRLAGRGFVQPRRVYGLLQSGDINEDYLLKLIEQMEKTSSEIYSHPLSCDASELLKRENPGGERELQALTSKRVLRAIEDAGFRLATYETLRITDCGEIHHKAIRNPHSTL